MALRRRPWGPYSARQSRAESVARLVTPQALLYIKSFINIKQTPPTESKTQHFRNLKIFHSDPGEITSNRLNQTRRDYVCFLEQPRAGGAAADRAPSALCGLLQKLFLLVAR
ncbi:hypothetical protein EVAR_64440_1 [Eumeta japonica]|uniref:Uncharacterized protein n=1 Tax=Eumeta variegata TaxID=151549 RepID=A0A4C1YTX2_EUMVA|nr:hypothetical protein EVAR_64440_1 [Eumeta japonica]